ncbi:putative immunity protein [Ensifer sp. 4252]|uniref:putative immunity protein n=1 Tax=Ensifer sp. 4252 TaxID=3373915 RepID=UPI003D1CBA35
MPTETNPPLLNEEDLRHVALWAAVCAERALPLFEAKAQGDTRPRAALSAIRAFAQGGARTATLRRLAWGANAAAREVGDPAASAAARAAMAAAGSAYTHPIATPHQVNHILGPAAYSAQAAALAALDPAGTLEAEVRWAISQASPEVRHIVQRMPARAPSKGQFHALLYRLDAGLRH